MKRKDANMKITARRGALAVRMKGQARGQVRGPALAGALAIALAACGGEPAGEAESDAARGEVLGGTISDEMLPLDTVRSQSPPLEERGESAGAGQAATAAAPAGPAAREAPAGDAEADEAGGDETPPAAPPATGEAGDGPD